MKAVDAAPAAKALSENGRALALIHNYFDDARQRGLPPHHAINAALGKLANLHSVGTNDEIRKRTEE